MQRGKLDMCVDTSYAIGINDMTLAKKLIRAGSEHRKFMRQIFVSVDIRIHGISHSTQCTIKIHYFSIFKPHIYTSNFLISSINDKITPLFALFKIFHFCCKFSTRKIRK